MTNIAYLNGEYQALEDCKVSVLDRGFVFGDAVYELIPVYAAKPFHLKAHLDRLARSIEQVNITNPFDPSGWEDIIHQLIAKSGLEKLYVYLQITRGVAPRDHAFPADTTPTVFGMIGQWPHINDSVYDEGLSAVTVPDMRWDRCDIKVTSLLANVLMRQHATQENTSEAILIRDGYVLEGAATNVFVVKDSQVLTAPKNHLILPGITRDVVVELLRENNISLQESAPTLEQLENADEVWLTSSTKECLPVTQINNRPVGSGKPGALWKKAYDWFQLHKQDCV